MKNFIVLMGVGLCAMQTISGCKERAPAVQQQARKTTVMKQSAEPIGTATMHADRSIVLNLRAETDGDVGHAQFNYQVGDPMYVKILEHVGGLKPGEEKIVLPFPEK